MKASRRSFLGEYQRGIDAELRWAEGDLARELWAKEHGGRI